MISLDGPSYGGALRRLLTAEYGFALVSLQPLPVGSEGVAFIAQTATTQYFVKLHDPEGSEHLEFTLKVAHWLHDACGLGTVLAPLRTGEGAVRTYLRHLPVSVHPFIVGQSPVERSLTEQETIRLGTLVDQVHRSGATLPWRDGPTERFEIGCVDTLDRLLTTRSAATHTLNSYQCRVVEFSSAKRDREASATAVHASVPWNRNVITHGDSTASDVMSIPTGVFTDRLEWSWPGPALRGNSFFFSGPNFAHSLMGTASLRPGRARTSSPLFIHKRASESE